MFRKITALAAAALMMAALSGCALQTLKNSDYGEFEGYFSELSYEVTNDAGDVTEQMYILHTDEEHRDSVGKKDVYFDDNGEMYKYNVTIGSDRVEEIVSFTKGEDSGFYSELHFDENEVMIKAVWDNSYISDDGESERDYGEREYFPDGKTVKREYTERYIGGKLIERITREYSESGDLTLEKTEKE